MIRGILFDLDNTLLDFMRLKQVAVDAAVSSMIDSGLPMEHEAARKKIYDLYNEVGIENQEIFDLFLEENFQTIEYKWLASAVVAYRRARDGAMVTYPHVRQTLTELLRRRLRLAVISDAPRLGAWLRLCHLELQHMFDPVITFEDTGYHKPSPHPFAKALDIMGMGPDEVLMIGDWPERDMVGAKGLGMKTVFAKYGDTKNTVESGADFDIDDISEIVQILDHLETDLDKTDLFQE